MAQVCTAAVNADVENQITIIESLEILLNNNSEESDCTPDDLEMIFNMVIDCLNNWDSVASERLVAIIEKIIEKHPRYNQLTKVL